MEGEEGEEVEGRREGERTEKRCTRREGSVEPSLERSR